MIMKVLTCALVAVVLSVLYLGLAVLSPDTARFMMGFYLVALTVNLHFHRKAMKEHHRGR